MEKSLVRKGKFKVRTIKDLFIKHGNHTSEELPVSIRISCHGHSKTFQEILDSNSLALSLLYLRFAVREVKTFGRDLDIQRIQDVTLNIMLLSLIVNEHLERQCYLAGQLARQRGRCLTDHDC